MRAYAYRGALVLAAIAAAAPAVHADDNPAEAVELGKVEVVGTTPLPGLGVPLDRVPANVQLFGRNLQDRPSTLPDLLDRRAISALASQGQGNPFQPDFSYRGFSASPLLGLPQGLGVFQDGVRINEPFGDVVNWDLLPRSAISSVQLLPGSMPAFGLNTLGGALAIYTKSGAQYPGFSAEASGGSFGTKSAEFEYGGATDRVDWFATGNFGDDDGWADHNPSRVRQFFGKLGFQDARSDLDVTLTLADNAL